MRLEKNINNWYFSIKWINIWSNANFSEPKSQELCGRQWVELLRRLWQWKGELYQDVDHVSQIREFSSYKGLKSPPNFHWPVKCFFTWRWRTSPFYITVFFYIHFFLKTLVYWAFLFVYHRSKINCAVRSGWLQQMKIISRVSDIKFLPMTSPLNQILKFWE